ncbi:nucleoid-associated protein [Flavobacterium sp. ST-75]|uniref:Nucleoid-associated protein n=1 Tax=Flavobacterium rhizophilum TaxID=3163296 RepID=A0ABW8YHZ2_9FLAO
MTIKNIVLHQIIKEKKGKPDLNCSDKLIPINTKINEFVVMLTKSYNAKNPTQGTFEDDIDNYPFQKKCKIYLDDNDFLVFSREAMEILKKEIDSPTTTGGYVVFVHYEEKSSDYLITAMLDKSTQFTVDDENLDIEKLMTLDVEKLARANRLSIKRWENKYPLYLSFIKGTRDVSKYFLKFIGSTDLTSSKENLSVLHKSINKFYIEQKYSLEEKDRAKEAVSDYIKACYNDKKDVELESISSLLKNENPTEFLDFLQKNEIEVSGKISIHKKSDFDSFTRNKLREKGYTLTFEKALIRDGKITKQDNDIIIHNVQKELLDNIFDDE